MFVAGGRKPVKERIAKTCRKRLGNLTKNTVARFDQVIDVSDADRALALVNIEKAADYYDVNLAETSWHGLGVRPQKSRRAAAAKGAVTRERRVQS